MVGAEHRLEDLLARSAGQYAELYEVAMQIAEYLACRNFEQVRAQVAIMLEQQAAASQLDAEILPQLQQDPATWEEHPAYRKRLTMIEAILAANELLLPKIRGMMAVTSAELEQLRGGRVALAGYAVSERDRRGLRGVG